MVNEKHDPKRLRDLDQRRLRRQFLHNLQNSRDQENKKKQTGAVLQEYYWRMRDMEVEKDCRKTERVWHQREKQRQVEVERKRSDLAEQSDEALSMRYGRIFAPTHEEPVRQNVASVETLEQPSARPASELEMESMWEAEALAVFQAAYNGAVGRFVTPTPTEEERHPSDGGFADDATLTMSEGQPDRTSRLGCLPKGRVQWESPRNPWALQNWRASTQTGGPPPVEAVVAAILSGGATAKARSATQGAPTQQTIMRWQQLPPVLPDRAVRPVVP